MFGAPVGAGVEIISVSCSHWIDEFQLPSETAARKMAVMPHRNRFAEFPLWPEPRCTCLFLAVRFSRSMVHFFQHRTLADCDLGMAGR
jgi:hypothetical protein